MIDDDNAEMSAYRVNYARSIDDFVREPAEIVAGGRMHRLGGHPCRPPGWWARNWNSIQYGDKWECTCGSVWTWRYSPGPHITDKWVWVSDTGDEKRYR